MSSVQANEPQQVAGGFFSPQALADDPTVFLWRVDMNNNRLVFLKLTPETLRDSIFLDDRIAHPKAQTLSVAINDFR